LTHLPPSFFSYKLPAPTNIYTLSLHDALPIFKGPNRAWIPAALIDDNSYIRIRARTVRDNVRNRPKEVLTKWIATIFVGRTTVEDRKSTRLNSSHVKISYAVFCLKKKSRSIFI